MLLNDSLALYNLSFYPTTDELVRERLRKECNKASSLRSVGLISSSTSCTGSSAVSSSSLTCLFCSQSFVTRRCARHVRARIADRDLARDLTANGENSVEQDGPAASDADAVRRAISKLPPDHAATIALFYLEEMSITEVSVALDIPPGTVKTRLMHARSKLKHALKGDYDEQT